MMDINQEKWDSFVLTHSGSFLQSYEWGEFQESLGRRVVRINNSDWQAQFIEVPLPLDKKYWYCPRGPIFENYKFPFGPSSGQGQIPNSKQIEEFIDKIKEAAKKEPVIFFRIGPQWPADIELEARLEIIGFKKLRYDIEPSKTLILEIKKSQENILAQMHSKWRYNIGLAQKKKVTIKNFQASQADDQFEEFWGLVVQTAKRQKIKTHPKEYYQKQFKINGELKIELFLAEYKNKIIAANSVCFFGKKATYLHGGSDNEFRSKMAPHLLQWEQIREAKRHGCFEYDFWGIDEKKWPGVTRFKKGFGGHEESYIGHWDYPLDKKWYLIYRGVQKFRR